MTDKTAYFKGLAGEDAAAGFLGAKGMVLLHQRYHSPFGEIDLVMQDGDVLAFVEVKSRPDGRVHSGEYAVSPGKQRRIIQTARCYLAENPWTGVIRFDVVELTLDGIRHLPNAFEGREW
ncbi:MAG: YraN family protein [Clostridiales bacterium]|nr:YraN family protein [Clostridiales bacterium]